MFYSYNFTKVETHTQQKNEPTTYFQTSMTPMKTSRPRRTEQSTITADVWKDGLLR